MSYRIQDNWASDYDYLVDLGFQIESKLRKGGGAQVRREVTPLLREYKEGVESLRSLANHRSLSERDRTQRKKQIDELTEKLDGFNRSLTFDTPLYHDDNESRSHTSSTGPGLGHRMTADELQTRQRQMIAEQDRGLDAISAALRRQQRVGLAIQDEVSEHNVLIDEISAGTSRADSRIKRETQRIEERRKKEKTWCTCILWTIVIVLAIAIIVIAVVPK